MPVLQIVLDASFTILMASDLFLNAVNKKLEDIEGKFFLTSFLHNDEIDGASEEMLGSLNKVLQNKNTDKVTVKRYDQKNGIEELQYWTLTHTPILDNNKAVKFIIQHISVASDIEKFSNELDRLRAGEEFNFTNYLSENKTKDETEILSRAILENSPDCIKIIDKDGRIKFMNDKGICLLEVQDFKEVQNKFWWDLWEQEDKHLIQNAVTQALNKEKVHFQASAKTAKGNIKWWDVIVLPMQVNEVGQTEQLLTVSREITDYKNANLKILESEKHFRQLANMMPTKISNATAEGSFLYLNNTWLDYTGKSFEDLKGFGYYSILHADEVEIFTNNFLHAAQTENIFKMELRILDTKGSYKWHLILAKPIKDSTGKTTTWLCNTIEIHEQIKQKQLLEIAVTERTLELETANKELIYQNKEKEQRSLELGVANIELAFQNTEKEKRATELLIANADLHSFTYVASHDLQEPIRKIIFFADTILDAEFENLSDTGKDYFRRMQKSAIRMKQLIEDLLSFSKVNNVDRLMELTDLKSMVLEVEEELKESVENKHIIIDIQSTCKINVISFQFRQLLHNLLGNSIKFAQPDVTPNIIIGSQTALGKEIKNDRLVAEKRYCHITIKDNGIGFEPEYSKRIFEVFQRLNSKEMYNGTGIGLAIVKKIVDNHNGIITATSVIGEGATFDIYLPV